MEEIEERVQKKESEANATILEMVGDIPDADIRPPDSVLFVCKLNPVTTDEDMEIIFSRFGAIKSCEVIRDHKSGESLQYAFIEYERSEDCEDAYFKMDNVLIDDRRIHVDFSQSVSKLKLEQNPKAYSDEKRPSVALKGKFDQSSKGKNYALIFDEEEKQKGGRRDERRGGRYRSPDRRHSRGRRSRSPYSRHHSSQRRDRDGGRDREMDRGRDKDRDRDSRRRRSRSPRRRRRSRSRDR
eukprot:m.276720 g.276720  ORF g.276720 m.276720 type:complete len:241 (+) comp40605_c0_seq92:1783-2505(+)